VSRLTVEIDREGGMAAVRKVSAALVAATLMSVPGAGLVLGAHNGCAAPQSGWSERTVEAAAARIYPGLLDSTPWPTLGDFVLQIATEDTNNDGDVCLLVMWGADLNPKSHWYKVGLELLGSPVEQFFVRDNTGRN
jgi:hypothetical protein